MYCFLDLRLRDLFLRDLFLRDLFLRDLFLGVICLSINLLPPPTDIGITEFIPLGFIINLPPEAILIYNYN